MSENKSKFNIKYINTNIGHVYYRFAEFFLKNRKNSSQEIFSILNSVYGVETLITKIT